jgi:hypothetical protein
VIFNERSKFVGTHAILSASKYHWIHDNVDEMRARYRNAQAVQTGIEKHALAHALIKHKQKLPDEKLTLNLYVNDAIDLGMSPEQLVFYSPNAYGTADTISFEEENALLRVHDLKTGVTKGSVHQLEVYAAFFCLEYRKKPFDINFELSLYQSNQVFIYEGDPDVITRIMDVTVTFDRYIEEWKLEALA